MYFIKYSIELLLILTNQIIDDVTKRKGKYVKGFINPVSQLNVILVCINANTTKNK